MPPDGEPPPPLLVFISTLAEARFVKISETYNTELVASAIEKYIDGEDDIVAWTKAVNRFALVRNQYLGITKGFEIKHFQLSNIIKLRVAGMEDSEINTY